MIRLVIKSVFEQRKGTGEKGSWNCCWMIQSVNPVSVRACKYGNRQYLTRSRCQTWFLFIFFRRKYTNKSVLNIKIVFLVIQTYPTSCYLFGYMCTRTPYLNDLKLSNFIRNIFIVRAIYYTADAFTAIFRCVYIS